MHWLITGPLLVAAFFGLVVVGLGFGWLVCEIDRVIFRGWK
jgi:hypothetical protein